MPGIDHEVTEYFVPTDLKIKPIKQKFRRPRLEWVQKIKKKSISR